MLPKLAVDFIARGSPVKVTRSNGSVAFGVVESIYCYAAGYKTVKLEGRAEVFDTRHDRIEATDD